MLRKCLNQMIEENKLYLDILDNANFPVIFQSNYSAYQKFNVYFKIVIMKKSIENESFPWSDKDNTVMIPAWYRNLSILSWISIQERTPQMKIKIN